jgi:hypothetical protein
MGAKLKIIKNILSKDGIKHKTNFRLAKREYPT